jgi:hypothetical protein
MNIKAIVTAALVIGSSSLALASPGYSAQGGVDVRTTQSFDVRDHRYEPAPMPAPAPVVIDHRDHDGDRDDRRPASWGHPPIFQTLVASTQISRNGKDVIRFRATKPLSTIKLQATSGKTQVSQVAIKFANGQTQLVYPNKTLQGMESCIDIDLNGNVRNVTSIVVYGRGNFRSSFQVLGA